MPSLRTQLVVVAAPASEWFAAGLCTAWYDIVAPRVLRRVHRTELCWHLTLTMDLPIPWLGMGDVRPYTDFPEPLCLLLLLLLLSKLVTSVSTSRSLAAVVVVL